MRPRKDRGRADPQVARLEADVARLRETVAGLRAEVERMAAPDVNIPVFELLAATLTRGGAAAVEIDVPPDARQVALVLVADAPGKGPATLEVRNSARCVVWRADDLRPGPLGAYTLAVPSALLPEGQYVLELRPRGAAAVEYRIKVRRRT